MSSVSARLRASLRLRLAILGAAALLLVSAGGLIAANTSSPGPFTGCLSTKLGLMYNIAQGATPKAACFKGDSVVTFSDAQGPQGPAGPGSMLMVNPTVNSTTAAPGDSNITAACPDDDQVTGGGYAAQGLTINSSEPGMHNTWVVAVTNPTLNPVPIQVIAVCAWLQ